MLSPPSLQTIKTVWEFSLSRNQQQQASLSCKWSWWRPHSFYLQIKRIILTLAAPSRFYWGQATPVRPIIFVPILIISHFYQIIRFTLDSDQKHIIFSFDSMLSLHITWKMTYTIRNRKTYWRSFQSLITSSFKFFLFFNFLPKEWGLCQSVNINIMLFEARKRYACWKP